MTTDTMFSAREVPWMKLGALVNKPVKAAEAAKLGGLDFDVEAKPVYFRRADKYERIPDRKAIVRGDTGEWLGTVGAKYPIIQFREAFDFMDGFADSYVAAGTLYGGKQGFMVVKTPVTVNVLDGEDPHELYGVLRTSHNCSRAVEFMIMPLRGRCMNQLTLQSFRKDVKHRWAVTHTGDVKTKLAQAQSSILRMSAYADVLEENARRLAKLTVTNEQAEQVLKAVLPDRPKRPETIVAIMAGWSDRPEVGYAGTGWGLVNAVSEYFDWQRAGGTPASRFVSALQGQTHNAVNRTASRLLTRA